jgi:hypothetical protein
MLAFQLKMANKSNRIGLCAAPQKALLVVLPWYAFKKKPFIAIGKFLLQRIFLAL